MWMVAAYQLTQTQDVWLGLRVGGWPPGAESAFLK